MEQSDTTDNTAAPKEEQDDDSRMKVVFMVRTDRAHIYNVTTYSKEHGFVNQDVLIFPEKAFGTS